MDPPRTRSLDPFTRAVSRYTLAGMTALNTALYRISDGTVGGEVPNGGQLLLLSCTGRRSGRRMTAPLLYVDAGGGRAANGAPRRVAVVASKGGEPENPAWFHNVRHHPRVDVQIGGLVMPGTARVADADERAEVWPVLVRQYRYFADYQQRATRDANRTIPVVLIDLDCDLATQWRRSSM
jgi:F420H(2)-dependent quinone reductase